MTAVVADTHVIIWLLFNPKQLSSKALAALEGAVATGDPIYVPSISVVEVAYLTEKGKLQREVFDRLIGELGRPDSGLVVVPLDLEVALALQQVQREEVPDMPDRIIAATASYMGLPLVTRDMRIRSSAVTTVW